MTRFHCPHLNTEVECTEERERHIARRHPDLLPQHRDRLAETLADPDLVRRSKRLASARLFSRWHSDLRGGKHVVVIVVSDPPENGRDWIITAYLAGKLAEGEIEWKRS